VRHQHSAQAHAAPMTTALPSPDCGEADNPGEARPAPASPNPVGFSDPDKDALCLPHPSKMRHATVAIMSRETVDLPGLAAASRRVGCGRGGI
jgi:hypothetical protein